MAFTYAGQYGPIESLSSAGVLLKSTPVNVYLPGTTNLASLFTDRTKATAAANPLTTDAQGNLKFFADPGTYDVLINGSTLTVFVPMDQGEIADLTQPDTFTKAVTFTAGVTVPANTFPESAVTNLAADLAARAIDAAVVHLTGTETISGTKTFSTALLESSLLSTAVSATVTTQRRVLVTATGQTITLPAVAAGRVVTVKLTVAGTCTVTPASGTIDGAATDTISTQYQSVDYLSDGVNWFKV